MRKSKKVIVSCAITGSIHTPTMSPYLPVTPERIGAEAIAAAKAGAAILHLHARKPEDGAPSQDPAHYAMFLPQVKEACDAVVNITTGGGLGMTIDQRLAAAMWAKPEIASMNMGSLNFNISAAADKIEAFQQPWEKPYLEMTKDFILSNTFAQIERGITELSANGSKFEFECYEIGHLYNLAHFADRGLVKPPFFVQGVFGILGGMPADAAHLAHMRETADRLFGDDYFFSCLGAGRHQMPFATMNALNGGHVRVGLEDSIYISKGKLAESNADQVKKIIHILDELSIEVATPDEARQMLDLKGADNVAF